jgi:hypothetical protein
MVNQHNATRTAINHVVVEVVGVATAMYTANAVTTAEISGIQVRKNYGVMTTDVVAIIC